MTNHPDDPNGDWDYASMPDIEEYFEEDGNLDRYSDDYDVWENEQYSQNDD
ncbi:MAG TPA: hypothetical protein VEF53_06725 [Patescibacteria group bacterium]|jgi:hypothetical protein|nr:hypothetical protein [Patescibacteria group bacterium]